MHFHHEEGPTKGHYWSDDGAELTYSVAGTSMIIIDHTEVPDALAGQGVGLALVIRGGRGGQSGRAPDRAALPLRAQPVPPSPRMA